MRPILKASPIRFRAAALLFAAGLSACFNDGPTIRGTVTILPQLQARAGAKAALYIVGRRPGDPSGPPVAVKRYLQPLKFPLQFTLSEDDVMIPNMPFEGQLVITARLSMTGEPSPVHVGDVETPQVPPPVEVGASGVKLELNEVRN